MNSLILRTATDFLKPLLLFFSVFLLLRGHQDPGGGFTGGLVAASAYVLHLLSRGARDAERSLPVSPRLFMAAGLFIALASAFVSVFAGLPFMTGVWFKAPLPLLGTLEIGTPVFFDLGVYLAVLGTTLTMFFSLAED